MDLPGWRACARALHFRKVDASSRSLTCSVPLLEKEGVAAERITVCHTPSIRQEFDPVATPAMTCGAHSFACDHGRVRRYHNRWQGTQGCGRDPARGSPSAAISASVRG